MRDVLSDQAKFVFNRYDLLNKFDKEPAATLAELHQKALHDDRGDILYALAEGSYLYGSKLAYSGLVEEQKTRPGLLPPFGALFFLFCHGGALQAKSEHI